MPRMPFIGVRISWLMLARNSLLARLASSAASLAAMSSSFRASPLLDLARQLGVRSRKLAGALHNPLFERFVGPLDGQRRGPQPHHNPGDAHEHADRKHVKRNLVLVGPLRSSAGTAFGRPAEVRRFSGAGGLDEFCDKRFDDFPLLENRLGVGGQKGNRGGGRRSLIAGGRKVLERIANPRNVLGVAREVVEKQMANRTATLKLLFQCAVLLGETHEPGVSHRDIAQRILQNGVARLELLNEVGLGGQSRLNAFRLRPELFPRVAIGAAGRLPKVALAGLDGGERPLQWVVAWQDSEAGPQHILRQRRIGLLQQPQLIHCAGVRLQVARLRVEEEQRPDEHQSPPPARMPARRVTVMGFLPGTPR